MKYLLGVITILFVMPVVSNGMQDCEDDLIELLGTLRVQKAASNESIGDVQKIPSLKIDDTYMSVPEAQELTYNDLLEHFELYKDVTHCADINLNKEALLMRVEEEIKKCTAGSQEKFEKIVTIGTLSVVCLAMACVPFLPCEFLSDMHNHVKCGIGIVGGCGSFIAGVIMGKELRAYNDEESVIKRYEAIKQWLTHLK